MAGASAATAATAGAFVHITCGKTCGAAVSSGSLGERRAACAPMCTSMLDGRLLGKRGRGCVALHCESSAGGCTAELDGRLSANGAVVCAPSCSRRNRCESLTSA